MKIFKVIFSGAILFSLIQLMRTEDVGSTIVKASAKMKFLKTLQKAIDYGKDGIGVWETIKTVLDLLDPKPDALEKLDMISAKLDRLSEQISNSEISIISEINFVEFKKFQNKINTTIESYLRYYENNKNDRTRLLSHVNDYIAIYGPTNELENEMVSFLDIGNQGSQSLMTKFIQNIKSNPGQFTALNTSPNRIIFEFLLSVMKTCYQMIEMIRTAHMTRAELTGKSMSSNEESDIKQREDVVIGKVKDIMKKYAPQIGDETALTYAPSVRHYDSDKPFDFNIQILHPNRYIYKLNIYTGFVEVKDKDFVVTGVRFNEHKGVKYLQIRVGKLLPMSFIDQNTLRWLDPPSDIESSNAYVESNYRYLNFASDTFYFNDNTLLTGVQFSYSSEQKVEAGGRLREPFNVITMNLKGRKPEDSSEVVKNGPRNHLVRIRQFSGNDVELIMPTPLCGIGFGIYDRKEKGSSPDMLLPKVVTSDYKNYV